MNHGRTDARTAARTDDPKTYSLCWRLYRRRRLKNGLVDQTVTSKQPLSDSGILGGMADLSPIAQVTFKYLVIRSSSSSSSSQVMYKFGQCVCDVISTVTTCAEIYLVLRPLRDSIRQYKSEMEIGDYRYKMCWQYCTTSERWLTAAETARLLRAIPAVTVHYGVSVLTAQRGTRGPGGGNTS